MASKQIGPSPPARKLPPKEYTNRTDFLTQSNVTVSRSWIGNRPLYSARKNITMHSQLCYLLSGKLIFQDLRLFIKDGRQMAVSVGGNWKRKFYKDDKVWRQWI